MTIARNKTGSILIVMAAGTCAQAGHLSKAWELVHKELNGAGPIPWKSVKDAELWAGREAERLEPIVIQILKGERQGTPWSSALPIARAIPSKGICDVLLDRAHDIVRRNPSKVFAPNSADVGGLSYIIEIVSVAKDPRIIPVATELVGRRNQASRIIEQSVHALRRIGHPGAIATIRSIPSRALDPDLERVCLLAEKLLEAKLDGADMLDDAEEPLRALLVTYVGAIERRDYEAYMETLMPTVREGVSRKEVKRKVFESERMRETVGDLKGALARETRFRIDRDSLTARMEFGDGYQLVCVLELEGWRIASISVRAGP